MLDFSKPLQTLDGQKVRIYAHDGCPSKPIHGAWQACDGNWVSSSYAPHQLRNTPPPKITKTGWVNIYKNGAISSIHNTKTIADLASREDDSRVACVEVTFTYTEGEGL